MYLTLKMLIGRYMNMIFGRLIDTGFVFLCGAKYSIMYILGTVYVTFI